MVNRYFVLVDKRDSSKFREFRIKKFNAEINRILDKHNTSFIWSFHKAHIKDTIWKKIKKNDLVYFSIDESSFDIVGKISKKIIDKDISKLMWSDDLNFKQITHFLLFEKIEKTNHLYHDFITHTKVKPTIYLPGIYEFDINFQNTLKSKTNKTKNKLLPKKFIDKNLKTFPEMGKFEVNRFIRDSTSVKKLKHLYENKCQICEFRFEYKKNNFYSEVHHYVPLEENGNDNTNNMIVVCPNHHALFDYKMIAIDSDGKSIIDKQGEKIDEIHFHKSHKLNKENIKSQLEMTMS